MDPFFAEELIPALNKGLWISFTLMIPASLLGIVIGMTFGAIRVYGPRWAVRAGNAFAALFRGTPLVVQLMVLYYGLPNIGIYFSPWMAALIGFSLCSGAYQSEYVRGALLSIRRGQLHAAQALGMTNFQTILWIVMPQAFRRALPGCGNEIIYLIKYSSLAYVISCTELTGYGKIIASNSFRFTEVFLVVGLYYLGLVTVATFALRWLENHLRIPGFGKA